MKRAFAGRGRYSEGMKIALLFVALALAGCAGSKSTIKEGFGYRMSEAAAQKVVNGAIASHLERDRISPPGDLSASGYVRFALDTHTFSASAIPTRKDSVYGFTVSNRGTMPITASVISGEIYNSVVERANAVGERVSLP